MWEKIECKVQMYVQQTWDSALDVCVMWDEHLRDSICVHVTIVMVITTNRLQIPYPV